jgi:hypothetical protein
MRGVVSQPSKLRLEKLPRLYCAFHLRSAVVADHLVILDLAVGEFLVLDEIATLMWQQLLCGPGDRNTGAIAKRFSAPESRVADDLAEFADEQLKVGRLSIRTASDPVPSAPAPHRRMSGRRAWWERAQADRDLRRGFPAAYHRRVDAPAARVNPDARLAADRLVSIFTAAENFYPTRKAPVDCLPRSLALLRLLRTAGWPAEHVIGVAMYPFEAHAWVELDGKPLCEGATYTRRFTVIQRA